LILSQEIDSTDLGISKPRILPGHPLYFLKDWIRKIHLTFTFNPVKKDELRLKFANEKLAETGKLIEVKKNPRLIEKTLGDFEKEIAEISKDSGENLKGLSGKLIHQLILHQKILEKLKERVPSEGVQKIIEKKRDSHLQRFAEVIQKVEEKKKIPERIEKEIENIEKGEFKEFKVLEMLEEVKDEVSENVRNEIEKKEEKELKELRREVEKMPKEKRENFKNYVAKIPGKKLIHLKIISKLETEELPEETIKVLEKAKERKIEAFKGERGISKQKAKIQIEKAEKEILKAKKLIEESNISEVEYGGKAGRRLLERSKFHLTLAQKALEEKDYGRAFGLAVSAYEEAINSQEIIEKGKIIKSSPEERKKKIEELYPGINISPKNKECKIPLMPKCKENEYLRVEKDKNGCLVFRCEKIKKRIKKPKLMCIEVWQPVCGKDGRTYSNECFAKIAGVEIAYKGPCRELKTFPFEGPLPRVKEKEKLKVTPYLLP